MYQPHELWTIQDVATVLEISEELVLKFIKLGIVKTVVDATSIKLNGYNFRRLSQAITMYENCISPETIEFRLNN